MRACGSANIGPASQQFGRIADGDFRGRKRYGDERELVGQHQGAGDDSARQLSPEELDAAMGFVPPDSTTLPQETEPIAAPPE